MTRDEFRAKLLRIVDGLLARTWVVTGENRLLLQMLRSVVLSATDGDLDRWQNLYPQGD
jgi:hypothetical protein